MAKKAAKKEPPKPAHWHTTESGCRRGRAFTDGLDHLGAEMDRKWGVGRLRLLVPAELRAKFDSQRARFERAVISGTPDELETEAERMERAWRTLDAAATNAGAEPLAPTTWETMLSDGRVLIVVQTEAEAHAIKREGRDALVMTLEALGGLVEHAPVIAAVIDTWPGTRVSAAREMVPMRPEPYGVEGDTHDFVNAG